MTTWNGNLVSPKLRAHHPSYVYLSHAVGKHVCHVKLDRLHKWDGVAMFFLCLSTEPSYEVWRQRYIYREDGRCGERETQRKERDTEGRGDTIVCTCTCETSSHQVASLKELHWLKTSRLNSTYTYVCVILSLMNWCGVRQFSIRSWTWNDGANVVH